MQQEVDEMPSKRNPTLNTYIFRWYRYMDRRDNDNQSLVPHERCNLK